MKKAYLTALLCFLCNMYKFTKDFVGIASIDSILITRDFANVDVYYDFVHIKGANYSSNYEHYIVRDIEIDTDEYAYVSENDKKFIMENFK